METLDYPVELKDDVVLPNHRRLRIRALHRSEESTIRDLYARLSPRTRYLRFFSVMPSLPDAVVQLLARVDYHRRLALVVEEQRAEGEDVVGLGSFDAIDENSVEVAIVVRDDWQRQNVGTALATKILQAAEARGFHRFFAHVLTSNTAIRRLVRNVGEIVSVKVAGSVSEVAFVRRRTPQPSQTI